MWNKEGDVDHIIEKRGLKQVTDTGAIEALVDKILAANPQQLTDYRSGKDKLFGYFVGQAMKESGGKMNPQQLNEILKKKLNA
jgi:aspartyl-tRNA(Asn)/glutamyl-tRNA(Gln) amidotransferase subunit B